jgi:hypothetical protein
MIQIGIIVFSCLSIFLLSRKDKWMPYGFIIGLVGQPLWLYSSIYSGQWGVFIVTLWFSWRYLVGITNYWKELKP